MKVIHRRDVIRSVLERYNQQYPKDDYRFFDGILSGDTRRKLLALDLETCNVADVDAAIGTDGWASLCCDCCDTDVPMLIRIGEEPDYEARRQDLCIDCLQEAVDALKKETPKP